MSFRWSQGQVARCRYAYSRYSREDRFVRRSRWALSSSRWSIRLRTGGPPVRSQAESGRSGKLDFENIFAKLRFRPKKRGLIKSNLLKIVINTADDASFRFFEYRLPASVRVRNRALLSCLTAACQLSMRRTKAASERVLFSYRMFEVKRPKPKLK